MDLIDSVVELLCQKLDKESSDLLKDVDLLESLIERCLISKLIEHVNLPEEICQKIVHDYLKKNNFSSETEMVKKALTRKGISRAKQYDEILRVAKINLKAVQMFKKDAPKKYQENIHDYTNIIYSIMRVSSKASAQEFYFQIVNGESSFSELASIYSEGFEKDTKGLIGPVPLSQPHPALSQKLKLIKPKEIIEPFYFGDKWIIAQLENLNKIEYSPSIENKICMELFGFWIRNNVTLVNDALILRLRK